MNNIKFFYFFINFSLVNRCFKFYELEPEDVLSRGNDIFEVSYIKANHSGLDARMGEFPFMVALFNAKNKTRDVCGGIIVTEDVVLTAGYCIYECQYEPTLVSVLAGVVDMRDHERDQWRCGKELYFSDEKFLEIPHLAALKVDSPFYLQFLLQTRPIPSEPFVRRTNCYISGWAIDDKIYAYLYHENRSSFDLKSLELKYSVADPMEKIICDQFYEDYSMRSVKEIICLTDVIRDINYVECIGQDGTVLSCYDSTLGVLVPMGITTAELGGSKCKNVTNPSTFFDIGYFTSWFNEKVLKNSSN